MANITLTQTPDYRISVFYPNSDSSVSFYPSSSASDNYEMIDDLWNSYDNTDYNYHKELSTVTDLFNFQNHTTEAGTIDNIRIRYRAKSVFSSNAQSIRSVVSISSYSSPSYGTENTLSNQFELYSDTFHSTPSSDIWTWSAFDSLLSGYEGDNTDYELGYRTGDDGLYETSDLEWHNNYLITLEGEDLKAYSYSYDTVENTFSVTQVDSHTVSNNYSYEMRAYYNSTDDTIYIAWATGAAAADLQVYLIKFDCSTESFSTVGYDEENGPVSNDRGRCYTIYIDDDYVYTLWKSRECGLDCNVEYWITIYSYSSSSFVKEDAHSFFYNGSISTGISGGVDSICAYDYDTSTKYIVAGWRNPNDGRRCSISAFQIDTSTDTIGSEDDKLTKENSDVFRKIETDGSYFYSIWYDNSATDIYLIAHSFDGTTLTQEASTKLSSSDDVKDICCKNDYIYVTRDNDVLVYSFDGSSLTLEDSVATGNGSGQLYGITVDDIGYVYTSQDADTDDDSNNIAIFEQSKVVVSNLYVLVKHTPELSTVTLPLPESISMNHSRNTSRFTFPDGDYAVEDMSRAGKSLSLSGWSTVSYHEKMQSIADMAHYSSSVSLSGLPDSNLDGDYYIRSFSFNQEGGQPHLYTWSLELEEA